jgi:hypothetical protein
VAIASFALQTSPASIIAARNAAACLGQLRLLLTAHTFVVGDANNAEAPSIAHPHCIADEWVEFEALTTAGPAIVRRVNSQHASRWNPAGLRPKPAAVSSPRAARFRRRARLHRWQRLPSAA